MAGIKIIDRSSAVTREGEALPVSTSHCIAYMDSA
jgi:hypothetical protein